jgi:hypothetical protein
MTTEKLFEPSVYRGIVLAGDVVPAVPRLIQEYQSPKNGEAERVNDALVRIFNDTDLHATVRSYGERISFAQYETVDKCYNGFHHLVLDPEKRMVLVRRELLFMADHPDETEFKDYDLFQTNGGVFYVQLRSGNARGEPLEWKEGVLASNDMGGYEFSSNFVKEKVLSSDQVLTSLRQAISNIGK